MTGQAVGNGERIKAMLVHHETISAESATEGSGQYDVIEHEDGFHVVEGSMHLSRHDTLEDAIAAAEEEARGYERLNPPTFEECGCCGHYHRPDYFGDCRNDAQRFSANDLDDKFGPNGWMPVDLHNRGEAFLEDQGNV